VGGPGDGRLEIAGKHCSTARLQYESETELHSEKSDVGKQLSVEM